MLFLMGAVFLVAALGSHGMGDAGATAVFVAVAAVSFALRRAA